jgi:hypothetical protein
MGATGSSPLSGRPRLEHGQRGPPVPVRVPGLELTAIAVAATASLVWVLWQPPVRDLAGQLFWEQQQDGLSPRIWNNLWYGGHHAPAYSALVPPLVAVLGVGVTGVLAASTAAGCFAAVLRRHAGAAAWPGALWMAVATTSSLFTGRLTFAVGTAFGVGALLAAQRSHPVMTATLGVAAGASSGVAAIFVALAGAAMAIGGDPGRQRRHALVLMASPLLTVIALSRLFPLGGDAPFSGLALTASIACGLAVVAAAAPTDRVVYTGALLYVLGTVLAFLVPTPLGGTAGRLGALVTGPLLLTLVLARSRTGTLPRCISGRPGKAAIAFVLALAGWWQWEAVRIDVRDATTRAYAVSTHAAFYAPLVAEIERRTRDPVRVEVAFTASHYEVLWVARRVSIARGWLRQLDRTRNALFYDGRLHSARYAAWLHRNGIRWVALPSAPLDYSARQEARIIRSRPAYLREEWRSARWHLFRVAGGPGLASGPGRVTALGTDRFVLRAHRPGPVLVRVRYTRYWAVTSGQACVTRARSGWTQVRVFRPGRIGVAARFGPLTRLGAQRQCPAARRR